MIGRRVVTVAVILAVAAGVVPVASILGAGTTVPVSRVTRYQVATTANTLKPTQCAGITLTTVVAGVTGTAAADLLLGSSAANSMSGGNGNDCILGGGGNDTINCGSGTDVALGGLGTDTFNANCETRIQ
jgi:Ca2+-binding RTX toxin-like protein